MSHEEPGGQRAALFIASEDLGWRRWMVPALLALFLLAPLLRWGLPVARVGALPLNPALAHHLPLPALFTLLLGSSEFSYKLLLGLSSLLSTAAVLWALQRWWGEQRWWLAALWLTAPLHLHLLYQQGWPHHLLGVAFLAIGLGLLRGRARDQWLALAPLLAGGLLLWTEGAPLTPASLLQPLTVSADPAQWLARAGAPPPLVPLILGAVVLTLMGERNLRSRRALVALLLAALGAVVSLWSGAVALVGLSLGSLGLILAAGALPRLDGRFGAWPVTFAIVVIAALALYPALQPPWQDEPPAAMGESAFFGASQIAFLGAQRSADGTALEAAWQITAPVGQDVTVFVHWLDAEGEVVGQADTPLLDGAGRGPTHWPVGTTTRQSYPLDDAGGAVGVRLGLYDPLTGARLPRPDGGDSVTVPLP